MLAEVAALLPKPAILFALLGIAKMATWPVPVPANSVAKLTTMKLLGTAKQVLHLAIQYLVYLGGKIKIVLQVQEKLNNSSFFLSWF